jgi:hypothetical protein
MYLEGSGDDDDDYYYDDDDKDDNPLSDQYIQGLFFKIMLMCITTLLLTELLKHI